MCGVTGQPAALNIQRVLLTYGYSATAEYAEKVRLYIELLLRWNRTVALTAVTESEEIIRFHFGESLFGMEQAGIQNGRLADLGSGAGFPGAPIAVARPELTVMLVESNGKKAAFLGEVRRQLGLTNVVIQHGRAEQIPPNAEFEFVTSRALGEHGKWLKWSAERLIRRGRVVLWLNSEGAEGVSTSRGWNWATQARIPGTRDRFVLVGEKEPEPQIP